MAAIGNSQNEAFGLGVNHLTASGRANDQSLTLGQSADTADQGLDSTSSRWAAMTPHSVLQQTVGGSDDTGFEAMERTQGTYQAGSMPEMEDKLSDGSDNID